MVRFGDPQRLRGPNRGHEASDSPSDVPGGPSEPRPCIVISVEEYSTERPYSLDSLVIVVPLHTEFFNTRYSVFMWEKYSVEGTWNGHARVDKARPVALSRLLPSRHLPFKHGRVKTACVKVLLRKYVSTCIPKLTHEVIAFLMKV